ncbi:hypothetical protein P4159_19915 [Bacillus thuringiensis]|uniref:hypothetical protein n=1 Tax=Bacillus thuringiensis TaxID=1428 RepID=UPI0007C1C4E1|nr:hypothetical protein [Bacillus thuringiensis]AND07890.1 hypothetical protein Bt4C1_12000 [Bacillus thuringiensis serovar alesti]MEC3598414.1 hypothetical protein [Bacillus thuringiensis]MED1833290.1 hypothetical protein [Bacillus thuringiensis]MED2210255.1 hypothetical protein [Bacillus thuringiensis]MED2668129.1 hypothetical protein [Bacillus thuringiensis]
MIKVTKSDKYDELLARHNKLMEEDEEFRKAAKSLTFPVGKKLELIIEITDEYHSYNLRKLLDGDLEGAELLGFKVNEIVLHPELRNKREVKHILNKVIEDIDNYRL